MVRKNNKKSNIFVQFLAMLLSFTFILTSATSVLAANDNLTHVNFQEENKSELLENFIKTLPRIKGRENNNIRVIVEVDGDIDSVKNEVLKIEGTKIIYEYSQVINGFSIDINKNSLDKLFAIEGIKNVDYSDKLIPSMVDAKKLTNVVKAVEEYKKNNSDKDALDGRGMVIASIDSGVDLFSNDLKLDSGNNEGIDEEVYNKLKIKDTMFKNEDGTPNYKVPFAFNYFRGDSTEIGIKDAVPTPHGMHIAGMLAGNSGKKDGFKGIAPNAQLLVYKVITYDRKTDTRPDLVEYVGEDAAFHAMDDAINRGADVISLSIGNQGSGGKNDIWDSAVRKAYEKGVVVVAAMGNWASSSSESSYDSFADKGIDVKDSSSTVSVAANTMAIGVGSTYNTYLPLPSAKIGNLDIHYQDISRFNKINIEKINFKDSRQFIYVDRGMDKKYLEDKDFTDIKDKIVLARRGGEDIKVKANRFLQHGAKGFILFNSPTDYWRGNNDVYPIIGYSHLSIDSGWAIGISGNDGEKLINYINSHNNNIDILFDVTPQRVQIKDKTGISGFSSWGPNYDLEIKPDILATGENIRSLGNEGKYTILSGTSMASPHVAGISTLLLQSLKEKNEDFFNNLNINKVDFVKATLMNTANVLKDTEREEAKENPYEYSTRRQGSGVIDMYKALNTDVLITYNKNKAAVSLKEIKGNTKEFSLTLHNYGNKTRNFEIKNSGVLHEITVERIRQNENGEYKTKTLHMEPLNGASLKGANEISIPANSTVEVKFTLDVSTANEEFVEGYIYFNSKDKEQSNLNIPFMGFKGNWNKESIFDAPVWEDSSKTKLTALFKVVPGHHGDNEYVELGREGNKTKGKENEELKINPMYYALNNKGRSASTVVNEIAPRVAFLRNVETYEASIVKEMSPDAEPVKILNTAHYPKKYIHNIYRESGDSGYDLPDELNKWKGRAYNPKNGEEKYVEEGQYYFRFKGKTNKNDEKFQVLYIPVKVDNTKPVIEDVIFDKTENKIKIKTSDNFGIWKVSASIDGVEREVLKVSDNNYEISDLKLSNITKNKLVVETMDYAGNQAEKKEMSLSENTVVNIDNIEKVIRNVDKKVKLSYPSDLTSIVVKNSKNEDIELTLDNEEDGKKISKFKISDLLEDKTFIVEWTNADSVTTKETFVLKLNPPAKKEEKEKEKEWIVPSNEEFTYRDTSLYPGLYFSYGKIDREIDENSITYDEDYYDKTGEIRDMKLHFWVGLKEGQRMEVQNTNINHNKKNNIAGPAPMGECEIYTDTDDEDMFVNVDNGVNMLNMKVYRTDYNDDGDEVETLIYNRGFFVYIDTERPNLSLKNENIVYNQNFNPDNDEINGNIYSKNGVVNMKGTFSDDIDGVSLFINENMIDSSYLPGEYGHNTKEFNTDVKIKNGEILKVEVKDTNENNRKLKFNVIEDNQAPEIEITPNDASEISGETVLDVKISDNIEEDEDFGDQLIQKQVFVNGKEYKNDALKNYAIDGEENNNKFNIIAIATDKAGNKTTKTLNVNVESSLDDEISLKKQEFTREELLDINNIINIKEGLEATIDSIKVNEEDSTAVINITVKDKFGFSKTYITPIKLVEKIYLEDKSLTVKLKKQEFNQDEEISLNTLMDVPEGVGVIILEKIDTSEIGEKTLKLKLFKDDKYNIIECKINILPIKYTVSYETNGGTVFEKEEFNKGTIVKLDKIPEKEGYTFDGWYIDSEFTNKVTDEIELVQNLILYAKWKKTSSSLDTLPQITYPLIEDSEDNRKEQWYKEGESWRYKDSNAKDAIDSWIKTNNNWYRLDSKGNMYSNEWVYVDGSWYWAEGSGRISQDQWVYVNGSWYWAENSGRISQDQWVYVNGSWYWAEGSGRISQDQWVYVNGSWYWAENSGRIAMNEWIYVNNKWYRAGDNGDILTNISVNIDGIDYKFNRNGSLID